MSEEEGRLDCLVDDEEADPTWKITRDLLKGEEKTFITLPSFGEVKIGKALKHGYLLTIKNIQQLGQLRLHEPQNFYILVFPKGYRALVSPYMGNFPNFPIELLLQELRSFADIKSDEELDGVVIDRSKELVEETDKGLIAMIKEAIKKSLAN